MPRKRLTSEEQGALRAEIKELVRPGVKKGEVAEKLSKKYGIGTPAIRWYMKQVVGVRGRRGRRRGRRGRIARAVRAARLGRRPGRPPGGATILADVRKGVIVLRKDAAEVPVASVLYSDERKLRDVIREAVESLASR